MLNELDEITFSCGLHSQVHLWRFSMANGGLKIERPDKSDTPSAKETKIEEKVDELLEKQLKDHSASIVVPGDHDADEAAKLPAFIKSGL